MECPSKKILSFLPLFCSFSLFLSHNLNFLILIWGFSHSRGLHSQHIIFLLIWKHQEIFPSSSSSSSPYDLMPSSTIHTSWPNFTWDKLRSIPIPFKIQFLSWQICYDCLPLRELLSSRVWNGDIFCPFCLRHIQTSIHIFLFCDFVRPIWFGSQVWFFNFNNPVIFFVLLVGFSV